MLIDTRVDTKDSIKVKMYDKRILNEKWTTGIETLLNIHDNTHILGKYDETKYIPTLLGKVLAIDLKYITFSAAYCVDTINISKKEKPYIVQYYDQGYITWDSINIDSNDLIDMFVESVINDDSNSFTNSFFYHIEYNNDNTFNYTIFDTYKMTYTTFLINESIEKIKNKYTEVFMQTYFINDEFLENIFNTQIISNNTVVNNISNKFNFKENNFTSYKEELINHFL